MAISSGHSFQLHRQLYFYIAPLPLFTTTSCAFFVSLFCWFAFSSAAFQNKTSPKCAQTRAIIHLLPLFTRRPLGGVHKFYEIFIECASDIAGAAETDGTAVCNLPCIRDHQVA